MFLRYEDLDCSGAAFHLLEREQRLDRPRRRGHGAEVVWAHRGGIATLRPVDRAEPQRLRVVRRSG